MSAHETPVMQQHAAAKRAYPQAIVFFRLGDFYEMFGDDALLAAKILDLTLTSRNRGKPDEIPMAGVPHHAAHGYIARLLERGHQVALCEQMADPSKVKGIVPRQVVRVITPGLVTDGDQLDAATNNYLCALELAEGCAALALLDLSTGELAAARFTDLASPLGEIARAAPREILLGGESGAEAREALARALGTFGRAALRDDPPLDDRVAASVLEGLAAADADVLERRAAARVVRFARACHPGLALPLFRLARWDPAETMLLDVTAQTHLELCESPAGRGATLLHALDATLTPPGARLLRRRLLAPSLDLGRIRRRLDRVELFVVHSRLRAALRVALAEVGDLERLAVRASLGQASPRDLGGLRDGLGAAERVLASLGELTDAESRATLGLADGPPDLLPELRALLLCALVERPPAQAKEGEIFQRGFDAELDDLAALQKNGAERMVELEGRLRAETGIATLKVRYTRVFGWYVEVSRGQAGKVPPAFRRKQTVASGERYTTPELDDLSERITHAEERHRERELTLLAELVAHAGAASERVRALAALLARWDIAQGLAEIAHRHDYTRPTLDASDRLSMDDGRHPVVERLLGHGQFVPNGVELEASGERLWLVTGPNMAGKSTFLRQVAQITIMAQMGSYVPARSAHVGLVDRVLSRVGASDNLSRGESTFMVEMRETAQILKSAGRRSLVILDEIGRGTSTFDGLSIAWAVAEYLDEAVGCRALFATHYHELVAVAESSPHAAAYSVSAKELGHDVVFLHRLTPGGASRSYGIAVAKLAGLPEPVLARARALLAVLEGERGRRTSGDAQQRGRDRQLDLFAASSAADGAARDVAETLKGLDVDRLTGLEALELIGRLQTKLR